jgi:uncharacterized FlaG/YvyC family protein
MCHHDTSTGHSKQSAAHQQNHPSDHTAEANAKTAKGNAMSSIYEIEKMIDAINAQVKELCKMVGVDPLPMPNEDTPTEGSEPSA